MAESNKELVVLMTKGADHELSSVGFTIANGGITSGFKVFVFLTSASVDLVRKRAADLLNAASPGTRGAKSGQRSARPSG
jgi:predicted peroxiredoxin